MLTLLCEADGADPPALRRSPELIEVTSIERLARRRSFGLQPDHDGPAPDSVVAAHIDSGSMNRVPHRIIRGRDGADQELDDGSATVQHTHAVVRLHVRGEELPEARRSRAGICYASIDDFTIN